MGPLVRDGEALGEREALLELQGVREHPGDQVVRRLGGVARDLEREGLVHAAVDVGEGEVEGVDGRGLRHPRRYSVAGGG